MTNLRLGVLCLTFWFLLPRLSRAESFLYLPITRTPVITAGFYGYRTSTGSCHGGIDYDVRDDGDGIIAAAAGTVEAVRDGRPNTLHKKQGYGNYVQILHDNGYRTIYGHLKSGSLRVRVGDRVRIGAPLGVGDNSGWSTGSRLHFEVRDPSGRKVDPYGTSPRYPNCGANALWVTCPPVSPAEVDRDRDGWNLLEDCDDSNGSVYPGATELCNGRDENCDGIPDDRWAALGTSCTLEPVPSCLRHGTWVCSEDESTIVCNADARVRSELCNNLDDDCDTQTDEDWRVGLASDLDQPCEVWTGECQSTDVFVCATDGRATVCGAEYPTPFREICDGLDNDCEGEIDNLCLCVASRPHPNCLCHECDRRCGPEEMCLVVGFNPDGSIIHTCEVRVGCYMCPGPGVEERICVDLWCFDAIFGHCINPAYAFCSTHCPRWG